MVKIGLQLKAFLECCTDLEPEEKGEFRWHLKLKCANCGEVTENFVYVTPAESQEVKGGRGSANCVIKCKLCSRENSLDIVDDSEKAYTMADNNGFKTIVTFDCRGVEPVEFSPRNGWKCKGYKEDEEGEGSTTGTVFEDVDLSDLEWADYDEKSEESTCISELEFKFVKVK